MMPAVLGFLDLLDVEAQAWLVSDSPLPNATKHGEGRGHMVCLLDRRHDALPCKSRAHQLLEESWFSLYALYTQTDPIPSIMQAGTIIGIMWMIERRLGYTPEYRYTDRGDYANHLRCSHDFWEGRPAPTVSEESKTKSATRGRVAM